MQKFPNFYFFFQFRVFFIDKSIFLLRIIFKLTHIYLLRISKWKIQKKSCREKSEERKWREKMKFFRVKFLDSQIVFINLKIFRAKQKIKLFSPSLNILAFISLTQIMWFKIFSLIWKNYSWILSLLCNHCA